MQHGISMNSYTVSLLLNPEITYAMQKNARNGMAHSMHVVDIRCKVKATKRR
jgi:hypothetical protein